jgi:hypothetical protein
LDDNKKGQLVEMTLEVMGYSSMGFIPNDGSVTLGHVLAHQSIRIALDWCRPALLVNGKVIEDSGGLL